MVKLVKSAVKCYKKRTKKNVGGKKKTYEYNQYLVPLKRSDLLKCDLEVFVVPQTDLEDLLDEEGELSSELIVSEQSDQIHIEAYEKEIADLEWKHKELSRSYKELVAKNTKTNQKMRHSQQDLEKLQEAHDQLAHNLKILQEDHKFLQEKHQKEVEKSKLLEEELSKHKGDFWTVIKSRIANKEDKEQ